MIDKTTIERILDATDIVEVINDFVSLKKRGVNYLGHCPFHNEKTPSFMVSPSKGIFKCFGCGKAGNAVNFLMEHETISYPDALKYLAKKYGIEIIEKELNEQEKRENDDRQSMFIVNDFAQKYFAQNLKNTDEGKSIGMSYFKEREIMPLMIERFGLGYSPRMKEAFTQEALKNGYKLEFLEKTGLTIVRENNKFDRFWGRVMFPIHSLSGKIIGFGGRVMVKDKHTAKYVNSPESIIYNKSKTLYGIYQAKKTIQSQDKCYLVEGYTDVISMHHSGIENVVASSGTSLTIEQVRMLKRFTNNVTVIYDGDYAGIKASLRGIDMLLEQGLNVRVVPLPETEDPDSYSKKVSATEFMKYIDDKEQDFISFKVNLLIGEASGDPIKRATMINEVINSIIVIPDPVTRSVYVKNCAKMLDIDEETIYAEIRKKHQGKDYKTSISKKKTTKPPIFKQDDGLNPVERDLVYLLINYFENTIYFKDPNDNSLIGVKLAEFIVNNIEEDEIEIENPLFLSFFNYFKKIIDSNQKFVVDDFFANQDQKLREIAINIYVSKHSLSEYWKRGGSLVKKEEDELKNIAEKTINAFKHNEIRKMMIKTQEEIKNEKNEDKIFELLQTMNEIKKIEMEFAKKLGR